MVRKEVVILLSAIVHEWRGYFIVAAWIYWEDENHVTTARASGSKVPESISDKALQEWMNDLVCTDPEMKKQHRQHLDSVFLLLSHLYDLTVDPHTEVATLATTVVDYIVAMLLESPFSKIQGTSVRSLPPSATQRTRNISNSSNGSITRQPSLGNLGGSALGSPLLRPLQRAESSGQVPTRSTLASTLIRTTSFASTLKSLASSYALGTSPEDYSVPSSPSLSVIDASLSSPPSPGFNMARYMSPYPIAPSPDHSTAPSTASSVRSFSFPALRSTSPSPSTNGHTSSNTQIAEKSRVTSKYTPADVVNALIGKDLVQFASRRRKPETIRPPSGRHGQRRSLCDDFNLSLLSELEELGLDAGITLNPNLPLKSHFYDWCLEYYKEPQMRVRHSLTVLA